MTSIDEQLLLISDCEARESRLTDWERGFIDSIQNRLDSGRALTGRQAETLDSIWQKVTADG